MAAPTTTPTWSTAAGSDKIAPTAGKQAAGFDAEERPPHAYLNWLLYWVTQWIAYFKADPIVISPAGMIPSETLSSGGVPMISTSVGRMWPCDDGAVYHVYCPLDLPAGSIISIIDVFLYEDDAADFVITLYRQEMGAALEAAIDAITSGHTDAYVTQTWDSGDVDFPLTIEADHTYWLDITLPVVDVVGDGFLQGVKVTLA